MVASGGEILSELFNRLLGDRPIRVLEIDHRDVVDRREVPELLRFRSGKAVHLLPTSGFPSVAVGRRGELQYRLARRSVADAAATWRAATWCASSTKRWVNRSQERLKRRSAGRNEECRRRGHDDIAGLGEARVAASA